MMDGERKDDMACVVFMSLCRFPRHIVQLPTVMPVLTITSNSVFVTGSPRSALLIRLSLPPRHISAHGQNTRCAQDILWSTYHYPTFCRGFCHHPHITRCRHPVCLEDAHRPLQARLHHAQSILVSRHAELEQVQDTLTTIVDMS